MITALRGNKIEDQNTACRTTFFPLVCERAQDTSYTPNTRRLQLAVDRGVQHVESARQLLVLRQEFHALDLRTEVRRLAIAVIFVEHLGTSLVMGVDDVVFSETKYLSRFTPTYMYIHILYRYKYKLKDIHIYHYIYINIYISIYINKYIYKYIYFYVYIYIYIFLYP